MIKNDKQYQVSKSKLKEFSAALSEIQEREMDPLLKKLQINALESQLEEFGMLLQEYEDLKKGDVNFFYADPIKDISSVLIKGRIGRGWTQSELAAKLELKEQQIQRYEACNYSTASIPRVIQIANTLGLAFHQVKVELKKPDFHLPLEMDAQVLSSAKRKLRERKILLT